MSNATKATLLAVGVCLAGGLLCYVLLSRIDARDKVERRYEAALVLSPDSASPQRGWYHEVVLPQGGTARISARAGMGGNVEVTYPSGQRYTVYRYVDYIYPYELRLSTDRRFLFVTAKGVAGGLVPKTETYEFDLHERKLLAKWRRE